uniref:Uncharacterized protein n=1 Tax=Anguilla anguilla TaxID=7936 RepID=A0A0E9PIS1_ANGAN
MEYPHVMWILQLDKNPLR